MQFTVLFSTLKLDFSVPIVNLTINKENLQNLAWVENLFSSHFKPIHADVFFFK